MPRPPQAVTARGGPGELRRGGSVCGVAAHGKRRGGVGKEWKERKREEKKKITHHGLLFLRVTFKCISTLELNKHFVRNNYK